MPAEILETDTGGQTLKKYVRKEAQREEMKIMKCLGGIVGGGGKQRVTAEKTTVKNRNLSGHSA